MSASPSCLQFSGCELKFYVIFGALAAEECCHRDTCYGSLTDRLLRRHVASTWTVMGKRERRDEQPEMIKGDKEAVNDGETAVRCEQKGKTACEQLKVLKKRKM